MLTYDRSRRSSSQPLTLSKASNSLQFTTLASRYYRQTGPPPEPIGKRAAITTSHGHGAATAAEILMTRKSKERSGVLEYEYNIPGMRRPHSRPASIRSSQRSSIRSVRSRGTVQRKRSIETVKSRVSVTSTMSGGWLSGKFSRLVLEEPASLTNIPTELVLAIVRYLSQDDLVNLICVCKQLQSYTTMLLYEKPYFTSTYRFAQFVTAVSHNPRLAELVREVDLSHISKLPRNSGLAGWREWKYRSESLYSIYPSHEESVDGTTKKHPLAHPLLLKYWTGGHDIPLGSLMHVVKSCPHLQYIPI
jgi:F-box-like